MSERRPVGANWPHKSKRRLDPERLACEQAVTNGLRLGTLVPQPCETCSVLPSEAHHDDYSKPLEVRWLCPLHHRKVRAPYDRSRRRSLEFGKPELLDITQQLRDEMDRQGLSQRQLGKRLGVSQAQVSTQFAGGFRSLGTILHYAYALGLTFTYAFEPQASAERHEAPHVRSDVVAVQ